MVSIIIQGCGSYLPARIVTNDELAKTVDTSHDWIVERTGIHQRHYAALGESTSDMAYAAAQQALQMAQLSAQDIDLIIVGTASPDNTFPSTATLVQQKLGNTCALAFDVSAACAGYLIALEVAYNYLSRGKMKRALIIGADKMSALINMQDRSTCVLFGDGAGAVILERTTDQLNPHNSGIIDIHMESDGSYYDLLHMDGGPSTSGTVGKLYMNGGEVFRHAVTKLANSAEKILKANNFTADQVDWLIPHQANIRIIDGIARKLNLNPDKIIKTVSHHANTSAASIPLALCSGINDGRIKRGDLILHEAIGGGLVWGSALLRY